MIGILVLVVTKAICVQQWMNFENDMAALYYVEKKIAYNTWTRVPFTEHRVRAYCDGYVDACDSHYPSEPMRIVKSINEVTQIVRETRGRGKVHLT